VNGISMVTALASILPEAFVVRKRVYKDPTRHLCLFPGLPWFRDLPVEAPSADATILKRGLLANDE